MSCKMLDVATGWPNRVRTGLPCFWLVTEGVTVKATEIVYLLFLKYLLTRILSLLKAFLSGQTDFKW